MNIRARFVSSMLADDADRQSDAQGIARGVAGHERFGQKMSHEDPPITSETALPKRRPQAAALDATDRKLLALLAEDATRTYAELGQLLYSSAPAVHERARRLKKDGVVKATVAALDGASGPAVAGVRSRRYLQLGRHAATAATRGISGRRRDPYRDRESAMLLKVERATRRRSNNCWSAFIQSKGFTGTRSYIALTTYLERGPSPQA